MKQSTKDILNKHDYVLTKRGLISYLHDINKLPFISSMYQKTIQYYSNKNVEELEEFL